MPVLDLSILDSASLVFMYLDVAPRDATYCANNMKENISIHTITTNKGKKQRKIYAPSHQLKWVQDRIRHGLLLKIPVEDCVHGFVRGRGIATNANAHGRDVKKWIMNIDLKNFFPSIGYGRVFGAFKTCFGFNDKIAKTLAILTTYDNHLCQGFSTSPDIANLLAWKLDRRLMGFAAVHGLVYTRYADDLTFSAGDECKISVERVKRRVREIVEGEGFKVNEDKVAVMRRGRRKKVTGLVVGDEGTVNLSSRQRRILRSAVHHWGEQSDERKSSIMGWINYLNSVDPAGANKLLAKITESKQTNTVRQGPFSEDININNKEKACHYKK